MSERGQVRASPQAHEIGGGEASELIALCGLGICGRGLFVVGGGGGKLGGERRCIEQRLVRRGQERGEDYSRCGVEGSRIGRRMAPWAEMGRVVDGSDPPITELKDAVLCLRKRTPVFFSR
jgi:hypothetical protein